MNRPMVGKQSEASPADPIHAISCLRCGVGQDVARRIEAIDAQIQALGAERRALLEEFDLTRLAKYAQASPSGERKRDLPSLVEKLLAVEPSQPWDASSVAAHLGVPESQLPSLRTTLNRLHKAGKIARVGWGRYQTQKGPA